MSFCVQVPSLDPDEPYPKTVEPRSGSNSAITFTESQGGAGGLASLCYKAMTSGQNMEMERIGNADSD